MQHFRYRDIEAALVAALQIPQERMGAFRGRLQHLRKQGVPDLPGTGKGTQNRYGRQHALQMLLALELEGIGIAPRAAAMAACSIVRVVADPAPGSGEHMFIVFRSSTCPAWSPVEGRKLFLEWLTSAPRAFAVIDLTACVKVLDAALTKQAGVTDPRRTPYRRSARMQEAR